MKSLKEMTVLQRFVTHSHSAFSPFLCVCVFSSIVAGLSCVLYAQSITKPLPRIRFGHDSTISHLFPQIRDRDVSLGFGAEARTSQVHFAIFLN